MTETPETDNLARGNHVVPTEFAEQLESKLTAMTEQLDGLRSGIDYASDQLHKVTEQRDGLRKRIAQLEDELAKACVKVEELAEIGLDQMDKERSTVRKLSDYRSQRDRLAMALQELCEALLTGNPRDITELLNQAGDALQFTTRTEPNYEDKPTPTPRTDAFQSSGKAHYMAGDFARKLERELTAMTEQRDRMAELLSNIYNYAKGKKPHDYHNLIGSSDQLMAKFDAWQEIECKIEELLQTTPTQTELK
jgi:predicted  nucleic acid-binding Zn-ribbon protein